MNAANAKINVDRLLVRYVGLVGQNNPRSKPSTRIEENEDLTVFISTGRTNSKRHIRAAPLAGQSRLPVQLRATCVCAPLAVPAVLLQRMRHVQQGYRADGGVQLYASLYAATWYVYYKLGRYIQPSAFSAYLEIFYTLQCSF